MKLDGLISGLKTLGVVVPVTVLVWLLAESESLRTEKVRVEVQIAAAPESSRVIRVAPGHEFAGAATVTVNGPTARVDALLGKLRGAIRLEPGMPGVPVDPGSSSIDLQSALAAYPVVRDSRVTIMEVEPATVLVQVDPIVTREARVRVELPSDLGLEGAVEVTPTTVKVRVPESMARLLETYGPGPGGSGGEPEVVARVDRAAVANLPEARRAVINPVAIELPSQLRGMEGVRVTPASVSLSLTPRGRTGSWTVASVPVHVRLAATELSRWSIELAPESRALTDVTISGPAELVEQAKSASTGRLVAYVALSFEELERAASAAGAGQAGVVEKEAVLSEVPTALKFDARQKMVKVLVRRREDGE